MRIARAIAEQLGRRSWATATLPAQAAQAAQLAKADLVTDMVGEFPELQGIMGRYYALHDGLDADGGRRHRRPLQAALRRRRAAAQPGRRRGGAGRQAGDAGRHVRHRQAAHRRQGSVRAAPPCAGRAAHADREASCRWTCARCCTPRPSRVRPAALLAGTRRRSWTTSSTTAWPAACASRATARRKSMPCWLRARSAWAKSPSALAAVRAFAALPEAAGAGRRQQAHRQHPEEVARGRCARQRAAAARARREGAVRRDAAGRARRPTRSSRRATTPPRCRRWPRCARRSMPSSTA